MNNPACVPGARIRLDGENSAPIKLERDSLRFSKTSLLPRYGVYANAPFFCCRIQKLLLPKMVEEIEQYQSV